MQKIDIINDNILIAHVFKHDDKELEWIKFLTPNEYPLQIWIMKYKDWKHVKAHRHIHMEYKVEITQEFLYVESWKIDIIFYTDSRDKVSESTLESWEFMLSVNWWHEVKIYPWSEIIEVKQWPYPWDANAKIFKN